MNLIRVRRHMLSFILFSSQKWNHLHLTKLLIAKRNWIQTSYKTTKIKLTSNKFQTFQHIYTMSCIYIYVFLISQTQLNQFTFLPFLIYPTNPQSQPKQQTTTYIYIHIHIRIHVYVYIYYTYIYTYIFPISQFHNQFHSFPNHLISISTNNNKNRIKKLATITIQTYLMVVFIDLSP